MKDKTFDELMNETNELINKLSSGNISMSEAMELFENGVKNLEEAKKKLETNKTKVKKILDDNKIEDFED